jgi:tetratricopeptide (TPR) repeat protein
LANDPDEADRWFARAMEQRPAHAGAHYWAGRSQVDRFFKRKTDPDILLTKAPPTLLRARELLARSLEIAPLQPEALAALGRTYVFDMASSAEPGLRAIQQASAELPTRGDVLVTLVALTANTGRRQSAVAIIEDRLVPSRDIQRIEAAWFSVSRADLIHASQLLQEGRRAEAKTRVQNILAETQDPAIQREARRLLGERKETTDAPDLAQLYTRGVEALQRGDYQAATTYFNAVLADARDPELRKQTEARMVDVRFNQGLEKASDLVEMGRRTDARAQLDILSHLPLTPKQRELLEELRSSLR